MNEREHSYFINTNSDISPFIGQHYKLEIKVPIQNGLADSTRHLEVHGGRKNISASLLLTLE